MYELVGDLPSMIQWSIAHGKSEGIRLASEASIYNLQGYFSVPEARGGRW